MSTVQTLPNKPNKVEVVTTSSVKIILNAEREIAYSSPDHVMPWGTRRDNSRNRRFNEKLYRLFPQKGEPLKILDLGCSGGAFVKDCLDDGCLAVGLEGSDYSKKHRRAEWATIPDFLFTCDITYDFELLLDTSPGKRRIQFDIITSWELIEHIAEADLAKVAENVRKHLLPSGLWIMSVSLNEQIIGGVKLHQTVKSKEWWIRKFAELHFTHLESHVQYFNTQFVRGPKYGAPGSFHFVLSTDISKVPNVPSQKITDVAYDKWLGSKLQVLLRRWLIGVI